MEIYLKLGPPNNNFLDKSINLSIGLNEVAMTNQNMLTPRVLTALTTQQLVYSNKSEYDNFILSKRRSNLSSLQSAIIIYSNLSSQGRFTPDNNSIITIPTGSGSGTLTPSGVIPGTYDVVTVDIYGRVVSGSSGVERVPTLFKYNVALTGTVDGVNDTFLLPEDIFINTQSIYRNGVLQNKDGSAQHYSISGKTITFLDPPPVGSELRANYIKSV